MTRPQTDPHHGGSALSRSFLPLALITLGVVFLLSNLVPDRGRGGLIVAGLGLAFLVGRVTTGRHGYAVPAGILIAIGIYIGLQELQLMQGSRGPGLFFVVLGLGFGLVYVIASRPAAVWPLFPAVILLGLGLVVFGVTSLGPLAAFSWIGAYWPAALILLGIWLLFREQLPPAARRPIATLGGLALLAYGLLAAASTVAAGGAMARTNFAPGFGSSPFADTMTLPDVPIAAGQTFTVNNQSGNTVIRASNSNVVHVTATRHYALGGQAPDVRLVPSSSGVALEASGSGSRFPFGASSWVEYAVDVPASVQVKAQSGSGAVDIDGVGGSVDAETHSGRLVLSNIDGAVQARSSSGSLQLNNVSGDVRVSTNSGQITGSQLRHLRQASSSSGSMTLEGTFTDQAQVRTSSGPVTFKMAPDSAVQLDIRTASGSVVPSGLVLTGGTTQQHQLRGSLGAPAPGATLTVETSSGSVYIRQ